MVKDLTSIFLNLQEEYGTVYLTEACSEVFIYKPLGRQDYTKIMEAQDLNMFEKENVVFETCVLYPVDYDMDSIAGVVTKVTEEIVKRSYVSIENREDLLQYYRNEMNKIDNQITCIIHEAFPEFDTDQISNFDVATTSKYLAMAEFKLVNLRGASISDESPYAPILRHQEELKKQEEIDLMKSKSEETKEVATEEINLKGTKKQKLSIEELKRRFPDINWEQDSIKKFGPGILNESVGTPAALIPIDS